MLEVLCVAEAIISIGGLIARIVTTVKHKRVRKK